TNAKVEGEDVRLEAHATPSQGRMARTTAGLVKVSGERSFILRWKPGRAFADDLVANVEVTTVATLSSIAKVSGSPAPASRKVSAGGKLSCRLLDARELLESIVQGGPFTRSEMSRTRKVTARRREGLTNAKPLTQPFIAAMQAIAKVTSSTKGVSAEVSLSS